MPPHIGVPLFASKTFNAAALMARTIAVVHSRPHVLSFQPPAHDPRGNRRHELLGGRHRELFAAFHALLKIEGFHDDNGRLQFCKKMQLKK